MPNPRENDKNRSREQDRGNRAGNNPQDERDTKRTPSIGGAYGDAHENPRRDKPKPDQRTRPDRDRETERMQQPDDDDNRPTRSQPGGDNPRRTPEPADMRTRRRTSRPAIGNAATISVSIQPPRVSGARVTRHATFDASP